MSRTRTSEYECQNIECVNVAPWPVTEERDFDGTWYPLDDDATVCSVCGEEGVWKR